MAINHILVPSDFSNSAKQALAHAFSVAQLFDARITLLHVVTVFDDDPYNPEKSFPDVQEYYDHLEQRAATQFKDTISKGTPDIEVNSVVQRGFSPYEEILAFAANNEVGFIAMGTHGRKPLARFLLGSVTEKVIHHADCPVLTVRISEDQTVSEIPKYNHLLVPTDFSDQSKRALELAVQLLSNSGTLDILHVVEDTIHPSYLATDGDPILNVMPQIKDRSEEILQEMANKFVPKSIQTHLMVKEGRIAQTILEHEEANPIDAIVMGTHGANAISQIFMGSQANRVVRKASCPVITIK